MPPPNITGQLHLGHALFLTLQDIQTRAQMILGNDALWLPGTDHAGLATHAKILESMTERGLDPADEAAYAATGWAWKDRFHARITQQIKRMGAACDWSKERFTLDEGYQVSTREAFRRMMALGGLSQRDGQWYLDMAAHAAPLIEAIEDGTITIRPEGPKNELLSMLRHIEPWCLSRQIGWGLRMPLIHREGEACYHAPGDPIPDGWTEETSTLDTWFLSALWPFATLGWPESTPDLARYYPAAWMESADDILFFWLARMLMIGHALTGQWAFRDIFLHGIIRDKHGRKMSKSLGNGLDPLDLIQIKGTDALRWMLATRAEPGLDMKFNPADLNVEARLINKIWQAGRFLSQYPASLGTWADHPEEQALDAMTERWKAALADHAFPRLARDLQRSFTDEFCSRWLEGSKEDLAQGDRALAALGHRLFRRYLTLFHPFLPFLTCELDRLLNPGLVADETLM